MTNPTVLGKALATLSEMQRGHPQKIQPTLEGNGIYPFPMVVQVHLLKKGIEIDLRRAGGHRYSRRIDGRGGAGWVPRVACAALARERCTARSGRLDQEALRDLAIGL